MNLSGKNRKRKNSERAGQLLLFLTGGVAAMVLPLFASMPNAASSAVRPSIVRSSAVLPETESGDQPVDLNQATELELSGIPGVGPRTAKKIVAWREEHGPYRNADDLLQIDGIGNRRYLTMAPFITIGKTKAP